MDCPSRGRKGARKAGRSCRVAEGGRGIEGQERSHKERGWVADRICIISDHPVIRLERVTDGELTVRCV